MANEQDEQENGNGTENGAAGTIREQFGQILSDAAKDIVMPAVKQAVEQSAKAAMAKGPEMAKDTAMKAAGAANPAELMKKGVGLAGEAMEGAGGIKGMAGKVLKKLGGGKGGGKGVATGHGQGRRIMIQQVQYVPVNVNDVYRAWTESEWTEYMHRVNTLDRQIEEDSARYAIGVKGLWFKKNFTAEVREQVPFKFIVWSTTQGNIKNTGRVSFHGEGDDLTLMVLNLDMAPSGLREKWVRGFRYHKRGVRGDFHRFAAWVQMRTQDELDELEGWLGTIKGGQITQSHEEYIEEHPEEEERAEKRAQAEQEGQDDDSSGDEDEELGEDEEEEEPDEDESDEEDEEESEAPEEEEEDEDEPEPPKRSRRRAQSPSSRRGERSTPARPPQGRARQSRTRTARGT